MASTNTAAEPSPASKLTEEAMDLVCSFVREEGNDLVMTRTLLSLSLVPRSWTSSAVRAFLFEPTRSLDKANEAWMFLQKRIRRPGLGKYVHALEGLARVAEAFYPDGRWERTDNEALQAETWILSLLRYCPLITSLAIAAEVADLGELKWKNEVALLKHLRHLTITTDDLDDEGDEEQVMRLLHSLGNLVLSSLSLHDCCLGAGEEDLQEREEVRVKRVELIKVCIHNGQPNSPHVFFTSALQHLHLSPANQPPQLALDKLIAPSGDSLVSLSYKPTDVSKPPPELLSNEYDQGVSQSPFPFSSFPSMPHLAHLTLQNNYFDLSQFSDIATNAPNLQTLDLDNSTWKPLEWALDERPEDKVESSLRRLSHLTSLALGWVPVVIKFELFFLRRFCATRGNKLDYKRSLLRRKKELNRARRGDRGRERGVGVGRQQVRATSNEHSRLFHIFSALGASLEKRVDGSDNYTTRRERE